MSLRVGLLSLAEGNEVILDRLSGEESISENSFSCFGEGEEPDPNLLNYDGTDVFLLESRRLILCLSSK